MRDRVDTQLARFNHSVRPDLERVSLNDIAPPHSTWSFPCNDEPF